MITLEFHSLRRQLNKANDSACIIFANEKRRITKKINGTNDQVLFNISRGFLEYTTCEPN